MTDADKKNIWDKLVALGASLPCHRCKGMQHTILDGYSAIHIQPDLSNIGGLTVGGPVVPLVHVACVKCGAVTSHASAVLGIK